MNPVGGAYVTPGRPFRAAGQLPMKYNPSRPPFSSDAGRSVITVKSPSGLMALPIFRARFHIPGWVGAASVDVDSAEAPDEKVATAPGGTESASIGVIGDPPAWIRARSFPLSPRAGVASAVSAAPVR